MVLSHPLKRLLERQHLVLRSSLHDVARGDAEALHECWVASRRVHSCFVGQRASIVRFCGNVRDASGRAT